MDTDSFILSFDTNHQELINFLQENKDEFDFSEFGKSNELYDPINKKVMGKMKIETSPVLVLDTFTALRSKSYSFSYNNKNNNIQKAKQKEYKKLPNVKSIKIHCSIQKHQVLQIYQLNLIYTTSQLKNNLSCV